MPAAKLGLLEEAQQQAESAAATLIERKFKEPANLEVMFRKQRVYSSYVVVSCVCCREAGRLRVHFATRFVVVVLPLGAHEYERYPEGIKKRYLW